MTTLMRPPIPYYGGKMILAPIIAALLPAHRPLDNQPSLWEAS